MTRILSATLLLTVCLAALAGCGGEDAAATDPNQLTIGVAIPDPTHLWTEGVNWWVKQTRQQYPDINWVLVTASSDSDQKAAIQDMTTQQKLDALVLLPTEGAALTNAAQDVKSKGIYLVNVDRGLSEPIADVFLEGDNEAFGRKSAEFIVDRVTEQGDDVANVVIIEGKGTPSEIRIRAGREVLRQADNINVLASQPANWSFDQAFQVMQTYLTQYDDIDVVWTIDDDMAKGAEKAIRQAGRENDIWIMGGGGMKTIVERVANDDPMYPADITYPPSMIAAGMHLAVLHFRPDQVAQIQQKMPKDIHLDLQKAMQGAEEGKLHHVVLEAELITPENAEQYYVEESPY